MALTASVVDQWQSQLKGWSVQRQVYDWFMKTILKREVKVEKKQRKKKSRANKITIRFINSEPTCDDNQEIESFEETPEQSEEYPVES